MGAILKFILILFCIYFIFSRLGGYMLRGLLWFIGAQAVKKQSQYFNQNQQNQTNERKKSDGEINIGYIPDNKKGKEVDFKGGDYVDYEEVK